MEVKNSETKTWDEFWKEIDKKEKVFSTYQTTEHLVGALKDVEVASLSQET